MTRRVILRDDVAGLGRRGEVHDVADGYARNFLLPKGLAMASTQGAEAQAETMRKSRETRDAQERGAAEDIAKTLAPQVFTLSAKTGESGQLFGSVSAAEIADVVYAQTGYELDRRMVELEEPIKSVGLHMVGTALHSDVKIFLQLDVVAD